MNLRRGFLGGLRARIVDFGRRLVDLDQANERLIFIIAIVLATVVLVSVVSHWPSFAVFLRWLAATIIGVGSAAAMAIRQIRRWQTHGPNHRNQYQITNPDAEEPIDYWRCDECHLIIQASMRLDVGATIALSTGILFGVACMIISWWSMALIFFLVSILAFRLRQLNRRVVAEHNRFGAIWRRGQVWFIFFGVLLIAGLIVMFR